MGRTRWLNYNVMSEQKKLTRSKSDKKLFGVCGGLAKYLDVDPTVIRVIWILLVLFGGCGILLYLILALVMPEE